MPEGDSIHRAATILRPLLVGQLLTRVTIAGAHHERLDGVLVDAVTPTGKHLTIDLAGGEWQLRVHLGMNGRWRRYRAGNPAPASASLLLATATDTFACVHAPTVELTARRDARRGRAIATLGPDLLAPDFDPAVAAARARARGPVAIGEVLLDQRTAAGIGNVYKSELLWQARLDPFAPAGTLTLARLTELYTAAAALMRANLGPGRRVTRPGPRGGLTRAERHHVYGQAGRPCPRCGARIKTGKTGQPAAHHLLLPGVPGAVACPVFARSFVLASGHRLLLPSRNASSSSCSAQRPR